MTCLTTAEKTSFSLNVKSVAELEDLNSISRTRLHFSPLEKGSFDIAISGSVRGDMLAIWRTTSKSGFITRPAEFEDVVTIRFPLYGAVMQSNAGEDYDHSSGQAVLMPFTEMQRMQTSTNVDTINCTVSREAICRLSQSLYGELIDQTKLFIPLVNASSAGMKSLQRSLLYLHERRDELANADDLYDVVLEEMLVFHLLSCWPQASFKAPHIQGVHSRKLRMVLDYIEAHLARPLTVSELAAVAGVSVRGLQLAFRDGLGQTPISYIIDQRLGRVHQALLEEEGGFISQIAHKWGFHNIADFSRRYKNKYGVTPTTTRSLSMRELDTLKSSRQAPTII
ncbi:helix-turn-helix domain-containing protein [Agrobacterium tumefaciens]|uniref:AraC family transcriptional regulator n=1 Tax=Agrobacterium tumefaciens TaxID=358 RepID=A0AA44F6H9_AGRTU|nr:AraC family transcriptional regulator [Agrobacterium tumefaciens]NTB87639.1 AraC family transcriptional regulator [Agrobacterium tumefaciens]NTC19993.1 AraC family transcriptional regulator [Agrobacterium tumefaciens]NTC29812.1 AraC family transcriptional regulator [Agrobacterium tumefaciens]